MRNRVCAYIAGLPIEILHPEAEPQYYRSQAPAWEREEGGFYIRLVVGSQGSNCDICQVGIGQIGALEVGIGEVGIGQIGTL